MQMKSIWRGGGLVLAGLLLAADVLGVEAVQFFRPERPTRGNVNVVRVQPIDDAAWIAYDTATRPKVFEDFNALHTFPKDATTGDFYRFRTAFDVPDAAAPLRFDVSADERFVLLVDGEIVARGPHRGMPSHWYYESYELRLAPGPHVMEAVVWALGPHAPLAQLSFRGGSFILKAEVPYDAALTTGRAAWRVAKLANTRLTDLGTSETYGAGSQCEVAGTSFVDERPPEDAYVAAQTVAGTIRPAKYFTRPDQWQLFPTERPDPRFAPCAPGVVKAVHDGGDLSATWTAADATDPRRTAFDALVKSAAPATVPPNAAVSVLWDLGDYFCGYPELRVSGGAGATVRWGWAESLRDAKTRRKGDRNAFAGKDARQAFVDTFRCDGRAGAFFTTPWWRCGRWCVLTVRTADAPLVLEGCRFVETGYPIAAENDFVCDDPAIPAIRAICRRSMRACLHEMFFDCPFYEQQMYPGDTRIQMLILSAMTRDDRLTRFAISIFDHDRRDDGMIAMNFPTRGTQESATYTMCWALMFRDYMLWHDNRDWLRARLPGLRHTLSGLAVYENADGLLENLPGWSFMDGGGPTFKKGVAPNGDVGQGVSALNNLLYLLALQSAADTEAALGETAFAAAWRARAERLGRTLVATFWDARRGLMADTAAKDAFSEHAQCFAILGGILSPEQRATAFKGLVEAPDLARCTMYFAQHLFEAYARMGRADLILSRLDDWKRIVACGGRTTFEGPSQEPRSDCHAWSACPEYFLQTAVAGVTPAAPFFGKVRVAPQPGPLAFIRAKTPCPQGVIETDLAFAPDGGVSGAVVLPGTLTGTFEWKGRTLPLASGRNAIRLN